MLTNTYAATLATAENNGITALAVPAISTGIYGYDARNATPIAVNTVFAYLNGHRDTTVRDIRFVTLGGNPELFPLYKQALELLVANGALTAQS